MVSYLSSAAIEHCRLMLARQPISRLLASRSTPASLRERLALVLRIRDFATASLGLPDNGSYRCYAELGRPYATWNVFAAPRFSVEPLQWRFPIVGKAVYRGYASPEAAEDYAARLRLRGYDTYIYGSRAYSTLGWFDDPVLNTFVNSRPAELAGVIFHELAHQRLFVKGNSTFNEAFAVTVEREGVDRWLRSEGQADAIAKAEQRRHQTDREVKSVFDAREKLARLYASSLSTEEKLKEKAKIGYTNAQLVRLNTYYAQVPKLKDLLSSVDGDLTKFYKLARQQAG